MSKHLKAGTALWLLTHTHTHTHTHTVGTQHAAKSLGGYRAQPVKRLNSWEGADLSTPHRGPVHSCQPATHTHTFCIKT